MKNKKGFAIIETLITTVVLTTALVSLYVLFNNMMVKEKRRVYYDDPLYIVRANYVYDIFFKLLRDKSLDPNQVYPDNVVNIDDLLTEGTEASGTKIKKHIISFSCDNELFSDKTECRDFFFNMNLYRIYISEYDMSYMSECKGSNTTQCRTFSLLSAQTIDYLKTLPYVPGGKGYYIIFEFNSNGDGNVCSNDNCMRQYASIKYGGDNTVVKLKS